MSADVEGKSLVELLDMLKPAPEPQVIAMTPQTVGWLILAVLLIFAVLCAALLIRRRRKLNAYRRLALANIDDAQGDVAQIADVLRRTALAVYPRSLVAGLYGREWIDFLNRSSAAVFPDALGHVLTEAPYKATRNDPEVAEIAKKWIKTHRVEGVSW
ncbi:DUF4381 domain-containing protein [Ruegeria sp. HU-ET01832]|uniref:DUF4381 domain-containing protein n=1 Tax=Ruegeria sp. HU-ET01832 TaxID=3135906 RepID=UPI003108AD22